MTLLWGSEVRRVYLRAYRTWANSFLTPEDGDLFCSLFFVRAELWVVEFCYLDEEWWWEWFRYEWERRWTCFIPFILSLKY